MAAAPETSFRDTGVTPETFQEFDIVVVGGGTAGLALATRVAASSDLNVGVLEAGLWRPDDDKINYPAFIGQSLMNSDYDWCLETVEQKDSNNRKYIHPRGKILGGSSALNFLVWQRGHEAEFDAWSHLGNGPEWSWKGLLPFFKKSATMLPPSTQLQRDNFASIQEEQHGSDGPVQVSFSAWYTKLQKEFVNSLTKLGLNNNVDGLRGNNSGVWASPATLDQKTWRRSYSASAHYEPNRHRKNLKVLCGAQATQILLEDGRATGVKYVHAGKEHVVRARKEVVLSGGSINSPQLLELSGIGSPEVLSKAGVECKVPLESVGNGLQEHIYVTASYELKEGFETWDSLRNSPDFAAQAMKQYQSQDADRGIIASAFSGFAFLPMATYMKGEEVDAVKREVRALIDEGRYYRNDLERAGVEEYLKQIDNAQIPSMEYIFAPGFFATASAPKEGKNYFSILSALQHPFSRGSVHITSKDPLAKPALDPRYFSVKADLRVLAKAVKWCDEIAKNSALSEAIVQRQDPSSTKYRTEEDYEDFVKEYSVTEYHPTSTCAMAPAEVGGVVDAALKVHGVRGLRVCDASVIPLVPSSHIVAVVYAIGEKGASLILQEHASAGAGGSH